MRPPRGTACIATDKPAVPAPKADRWATGSNRRRARRQRRARHEIAFERRDYYKKIRGAGWPPEPPCEREQRLSRRDDRAQPDARSVEVDHACRPRPARPPLDDLRLSLQQRQRLVLGEQRRRRGPERESDTGDGKAPPPPQAA